MTATTLVHHIDLEVGNQSSWNSKRLVGPDGLVSIVAYTSLDALTRLAVVRYPFDKHGHLLGAAQVYFRGAMFFWILFLSEHARKPLPVGTRTPQWANVKPPLGPRWLGPR